MLSPVAAVLLDLSAAISRAWVAIALAQCYGPGGWMEGDVETKGVQGSSDSEAKGFMHWAVNANYGLKTGT